MISARQPVRLAAPGAAGVDFLARPGTVMDRDLLEAELAGPRFNAGRVFDFQLIDALEDALDAWKPADDPDRAPLAELLHLARHAPADLSDSQRQLLAGFEETAREHWHAFAALANRRARREILMPALAVSWFLTGWEGIEQPFETGVDGRPTDRTLAAIPSTVRLWLGLEILKLLYLGPDEGKASGSPPSSPPGRGTLRAAGGRQTAARAGKSQGSATRKTRA